LISLMLYADERPVETASLFYSRTAVIPLIDGLRRTVGSVTAENQQLKAANAALSEQLASAGKQISSLLATVSALNVQLNAARQQIAALTRQVSAANAAIKSLNTRLIAVQARLKGALDQLLRLKAYYCGAPILIPYLPPHPICRMPLP